MRVLLSVPLLFLCACGGNDNKNSSDDQGGDDSTAAPTRPFKGGSFFGSVDTGSDGSYVEAFAILSEKGDVRIELTDYMPAPAAAFSQIVGSVNTSTPSTWTSGLIIGEECTSSSDQWGCGIAQSIEIRFTL